jgi:hypothetical protein
MERKGRAFFTVVTLKGWLMRAFEGMRVDDLDRYRK